MKNITLITGGQRSGKSSYAQKKAEASGLPCVYLATARHWDADFTQRIRRHQADRGDKWTTIEEEKQIGKIQGNNQVIVLDCITLWLTNIFHDNDYNITVSLEQAKKEWDTFYANNQSVIVVTNELGMGVHAMDETARKFTDLQGWVNQYIASTATEVVLMVAGIPVTIKTPEIATK